MENTSWHSYPKIYALGHRAIKDLFADEVIVEEKIDGSQFSFGIFNGELKCRSKGAQIHLEAPEKMFQKAVDTVKELALYLNDGWTYRGEYLAKPKHNTLNYSRVPKDHIILFDINPNEEEYLTYEDKRTEAQRLELEIVPLIHLGLVDTPTGLMALMDRESWLGGCKIEGMVIKNYHKFGPDKKVLMGKYVSEAFKEKHKIDWKKSNPSKSDVVALLGDSLRSEARWDKAIQHLRECGALTNSPKDIGVLLKEIQADIRSECEGEIRQTLFDHAWKSISRNVIRGFPEYYKDKLMKSQFET